MYVAAGSGGNSYCPSGLLYTVVRTPFGAINDASGKVVVVLDRAMLAHEILNYHPLVNTMTTTIPRGGLMRFLKACGHDPRVEAASEVEPVSEVAVPLATAGGQGQSGRRRRDGQQAVGGQ